MALGYVIIGSPYTPYSIYLRGTIHYSSYARVIREASPSGAFASVPAPIGGYLFLFQARVAVAI